MFNTKALEQSLYNQLKATPGDLKEWENEMYLMDPEVVETFWEEVKAAPHIEVVGDYDVDGICATYIMIKAILMMYPEKKVVARIPRRFSEGYGINPTIAGEIKEKLPKKSLIITVDNGIAAAPVLEDLKTSGYHVIVTDHHELGTNKIPDVDLVVNPTIHKDMFQNQKWCGACVAYKLVEQIVPQQLAHTLSVFAGLATVSDCMELREGNWGIVRNAIKAFRNNTAPESLSVLIMKMNQDPLFCTEETFSYYLGPAFNAPGRLMDKGATSVLKYLFKPTPEGSDDIIEINNKRKEIRDKELELVKNTITEKGLSSQCPIWVRVDNLHEGIVGILAGKITEAYGVPAIIMTNTEKPGILKGSARSAGDFHMLNYLISCGDLYTAMGGHAGAAGLSMKEENFILAAKNQVTIPNTTIEATANSTLIHSSEIPSIATTLDIFRPFGEGNPAPVFAIDIDASVDKPTMIGEQKNHLAIEGPGRKYKVTHFFHEPNELANKSRFELIGQIKGTAFRGIETPTFQAQEAIDLYEDKEWGCK